MLFCYVVGLSCCCVVISSCVVAVLLCDIVALVCLFILYSTSLSIYIYVVDVLCMTVVAPCFLLACWYAAVRLLCFAFVMLFCWYVDTLLFSIFSYDCYLRHLEIENVENIGVLRFAISLSCYGDVALASYVVIPFVVVLFFWHAVILLCVDYVISLFRYVGM